MTGPADALPVAGAGLTVRSALETLLSVTGLIACRWQRYAIRTSRAIAWVRATDPATGPTRSM